MILVPDTPSQNRKKEGQLSSGEDKVSGTKAGNSIARKQEGLQPFGGNYSEESRKSRRTHNHICQGDFKSVLHAGKETESTKKQRVATGGNKFSTKK